jgi:hypothetical protein
VNDLVGIRLSSRHDDDDVKIFSDQQVRSSQVKSNQNKGRTLRLLLRLLPLHLSIVGPHTIDDKRLQRTQLKLVDD